MMNDDDRGLPVAGVIAVAVMIAAVGLLALTFFSASPAPALEAGSVTAANEGGGLSLIHI